MISPPEEQFPPQDAATREASFRIHTGPFIAQLSSRVIHSTNQAPHRSAVPAEGRSGPPEAMGLIFT